MKKPAVVSLVVLALLSFTTVSAFADPAPAPTPIAKPASSAATAKLRAKPKARKPARHVPSAVDTTTLTNAPATPPVEAAHAEPPAAPAPVASDEHAAPSSTDEASASTTKAPVGEPKPIALEPLLGYASRQLNLGFGARASYTFSNHIAVAATFVYHLGASQDVPSVEGATAKSSVHAFYPGAEVGYDLHVAAVTIRPYLGVAALFVTATSTFGDKDSSDTSSHFAIYPGVTGRYDIPSTSMFAGADTRLLVVTDGGDPSFGFFATFGVKL